MSNPKAIAGRPKKIGCPEQPISRHATLKEQGISKEESVAAQAVAEWRPAGRWR